MHGRAQLLDLQGNQGIEVVVERVAKGRDKDDGAGGTGLVMVVDDLRKPLEEELVVHVGGFGHGGHVEVAVVIVPDVLMPEARHAFRRPLCYVGVPHVPVRDQFLSVGVVLDEQDDDVVQ